MHLGFTAEKTHNDKNMTTLIVRNSDLPKDVSEMVVLLSVSKHRQAVVVSTSHSQNRYQTDMGDFGPSPHHT